MSPILTLGALALYLLFLLALGFYAEKKIKSKKSFLFGGIFYSLSFAVYCTTWTFYGSIGNASNFGMLFATIYLGPTLGALLWAPVLKRIIRIKNNYHITSIIDFVCARYNKSVAIGVVLAVTVVVGFIPYNALQFKSIMATTGLILSSSPDLMPYHNLIELIILGMIAVFVILFGLKRLESTERHPGMIAVLVVESVTKLFMALAGGFFIVYVLSDGVQHLVQSLPQLVSSDKYLYFGETNFKDTFNFISWMILASSAVLFLPRQFHVAVIENSDEKHVAKAQWIFPLYLLLINLFVLPVAIYGLKMGGTAGQAESLLLDLPLKHGEKLLALGIYLGGFSAAIGMITVSIMTISTMVTNHLLLPLSDCSTGLRFLRGRILESRWLVAILTIAASYLYQKFIGSGTALVSMGMISFVVAFQFLPPILFGLFWSKANTKGALVGIVLGCSLWAYTLFVPAFFAGANSPDWIIQGPFGFSLLRPQALFGVVGLSEIAHSFLWTTLFNTGGILLGSLFFKTSAVEKNHTEEFLNFSRNIPFQSHQILGNAEIDVEFKSKLILQLLVQYFDEKKAKEFLDTCLLESRITTPLITIGQLADLNFIVERNLSGTIGSAAAHFAVRQAQLINQKEEKDLSAMYAHMLSTLRVSPLDFKKKVDFQIQKANNFKHQRDELERLLNLRLKEVEKMQEQLVQSSKMSALGEMAGGVAHEINSPLAVIQMTLEQMQIRIKKGNMEDAWALNATNRLIGVTQRIASIIKGMRLFSRSEQKPPFEPRNLSEIFEDTLAFCREKFKHQAIDLKVIVKADLVVECRDVQLSQVILNLLNNASDAIQGKPSPWIEIEAQEAGESIEISITDCGEGIPTEIANKIMQPFFTTKGVGKGVGLGLSISKGIVEDHGGQIFVDMTSKNTRFVVQIPKIQKKMIA